MSNNDNSLVYDLIIIGAGPTGMFGAVMAGYYNLKTLLVEKNEFVGGQVYSLYPKKQIHDIPGYVEISGLDYTNNLFNQVKSYNHCVDIQTNTNIVNYSVDENNVYSFYDVNHNLICKSLYVIFAIGKGSFIPIKLTINNRSLTKQQEEQLNVFYQYNDKYDYDNKNIVVLGGGDSALDLIKLILENHKNTKITLISRSAIKGVSVSLEYLKSNNVDIYENYSILDINNNKISIASNTNSEDVNNIVYDNITVQYGLMQDISNIVFYKWDNIKINLNKFDVSNTFETSIKNWYAAGDCVLNPLGFYAISTGQGQIAGIVNKISKELKILKIKQQQNKNPD